jgi:hypothetical protein
MNLVQKERSLNSLIEMGLKGHFPHIHPDWFREYQEIAGIDCELVSIANKKEQKRVKDILDTLTRHQSFERKMMFMCSLSPELRAKVIRTFLDMIENRLLDGKPILQ